MVGHPASQSITGVHSAELLHAHGFPLASLFGPEHGFWGRGGAGEDLAHSRHREWDIPVYSLYGETRRPTPEMLQGLDVLVFDLQNIAARAYTYVATLKLVLEAAAQSGLAVIVADRPDPLMDVVDGPMLEPPWQSFVSSIATPFCYGMTLGETAQWLRQTLALDLDLRVAPFTGWRRNAERAVWPAPWLAPSPAIQSRDCALCFPITVFFEALPAVDHARKTAQAFQWIGAPELDVQALAEELRGLALPGMAFEAGAYACVWQGQATRLPGLQVRVVQAQTFRPALAAYALLACLQRGHPHLLDWSAPARPEFFDKLWGTDRIRRGLAEAIAPDCMQRTWERMAGTFKHGRENCLMY